MSQSNDDIETENAPQTQVDDSHTEPDETTAGPAERHDPGNDNPATNAPVE
ncbi:hypothetical protein [Mobilicoccus massiliensis]|uniref:hypothetical protein n=1 Tax=Mobilicoccus massiliensis TaxID=1522310 RepID=UPI00159655F1|nr:hypothetical protein [Mobilicoccus massiliensis]